MLQKMAHEDRSDAVSSARPTCHLFLYRACMNICLCIFFNYFNISCFALICLSVTPILWICSLLIFLGAKATHAILLWHFYSLFVVVLFVLLSGGAKSEMMPLVTNSLVNGFNIDDQRVGPVTAFFFLVLYCGVLLVPSDWDSFKDFEYREWLGALVFVFSMLGQIAYHNSLSTKIKRRTAWELRKAVRHTTVLVDTLFALGAPLSAMSYATDIMAQQGAAITKLRTGRHLNPMIMRAFSVPAAVLFFHYFDKSILVYMGCAVYVVMLISMYLYWKGQVRIATLVFHLTMYMGIQMALPITGGVSSALIALVPCNIVAIFHGLGYQAGLYCANFAIVWYLVIFFFPLSWNLLDTSEERLNGYRVFFFTHSMLGIISVNCRLRNFFNHHVGKLETALLDLGARLGLPTLSSPKRCAPVRLMCSMCQQERWHTIHPTVVRTQRYGPAFAYMCTRCKCKSVAEVFPQAASELPPCVRHSAPVNPTICAEATPLNPLPETLMRRSPYSGPDPPTCPSKEEVKDQLFKLLQASDAWMDALEQTATTT